MSTTDEMEAPRTRQVIQRGTAKPSSAGAKVTVYCKLPTGIRIRTFRMVEAREQVLGGGTREFSVAEPHGPEIIIWGNRFRIGDPQTHEVIGDFGVTHGVDKESWDQWAKDNAESAMVKNKLVFAAENREYGEDAAHDLRDVFSGLGPMAKDGDPRAPQPLANLSGVTDYDTAR